MFEIGKDIYRFGGRVAKHRDTERVRLNVVYSVIGVLFGIFNAFVHYFGDGDIQKAIFWMLCALVCIMNLKETPK